MARVRRCPLRAPGRHFQRPPVQPARLKDLSARARPLRQSPTRAAAHRRAAQTPPRGASRLHPRRFSDLDGIKGLYNLDLVDEVTQFQCVGSVERISEAFLIPVLEALIERFPFRVLGFHADNGSQDINHRVVKLLNKLAVEQFTKSRARRSNDNALVESKNGAVVRKHFGYAHMPGRFARQVNDFAQNVLSPYLNFHRPCFFPTEAIDATGRVRKHYRYAQMMTPYDKLKSLPGAADFLKPGITFQALDAIALSISDNDAARALNQARDKLFLSIYKAQRPAA